MNQIEVALRRPGLDSACKRVLQAAYVAASRAAEADAPIHRGAPPSAALHAAIPRVTLLCDSVDLRDTLTTLLYVDGIQVDALPHHGVVMSASPFERTDLVILDLDVAARTLETFDAATRGGRMKGSFGVLALSARLDEEEEAARRGWWTLRKPFDGATLRAAVRYLCTRPPTPVSD
ncbi:MAG: hypothetical protein H6739_30345 [Alphaproteobacteria bacterium]|nr:hypothetical protein [Alphaproteobacteria bacterium]